MNGQLETRPELFDIDGERLRMRMHPGQLDAWDSLARFIFMLAGTQGGKTSFGPWWLFREIYGMGEFVGRGAGDYLAVTASYDLFKLKMLPAIREVFEHIFRRGRYWAGDKIIELADPDTGEFKAKRQDDPMWGRVILRAATSEGGLESATAGAAWLDECGQDTFTITTWEAVRRRLALARGRVLGTTTLYNRGWLKSQIYDKWREGNKDFDVIQFASHINPKFPQEEYDDAVLNLPLWRLNMFYRGEFDKPAGMIYGAFNDELCKIPPFAVPNDWPAYGGLDFGGVNTAAVLIRHDERNGLFYITDEYLEGGKTAKDHSKTLRDWNARQWVGGAKSEGQWRQEFAAAGLPIGEPKVSDVGIGINRVYGLHKQNRILVFDTCNRYLDEKGSYSRKIDRATGEPTEEIKDKNSFHMMDAERYIFTLLASVFKPAGEIIDDLDMSIYKSKRTTIWD